jgi:hypothetical protein
MSFFENDKGLMHRASRFIHKRLVKEPTRLFVSFMIVCLVYLGYWVIPWGWVSFVWSMCVLHWMGEYQVVFQKQNKLV